jgi:Stress responsive A/B Barrel Domain
MKKYSAILLNLTIIVIFCNTFVQAQSPVQKIKFMVRHTVIFKFKQTVDSIQREIFFNAALNLAVIPGVRNFELLKQTSKKNKFDFGISMEFENQRHYEEYNNHKDHQLFIQQYWLKNVEDFLETDYELLK